MKAMNITRKPGGGRGMISGPVARASAGSCHRRPFFSAASSSLSLILLWTQLQTTEVSPSAVLALLTAALVVAPAAMELLLPMAALDRSYARTVVGRDASQVYGVRRKKTAAQVG
jgi:hypothetical protein